MATLLVGVGALMLDRLATVAVDWGLEIAGGACCGRRSAARATCAWGLSSVVDWFSRFGRATELVLGRREILLADLAGWFSTRFSVLGRPPRPVVTDWVRHLVSAAWIFGSWRSS